MADFVQNIWLSVFTAGPTPTLVVATNASFAALQLVLLGLLVATRSVHFAVLSFLCAGLWFSINWFAREVMAVQAEEEAKKAREGVGRREGVVGDEHGGMDTGDDTERIEVDDGDGEDEGRTLDAVEEPTVRQGKVDVADIVAMSTGQQMASSQTGSSGVKRRPGLLESSGDLSTDSEWEKVDA